MGSAAPRGGVHRGGSLAGLLPGLAGGEPGRQKALLACIVDEAERHTVVGGRLRPPAKPPKEVGTRGGIATPRFRSTTGDGATSASV